jgi:hypothetical protein
MDLQAREKKRHCQYHSRRRDEKVAQRGKRWISFAQDESVGCDKSITANISAGGAMRG